jgi:hypothetical protein
MKKQTFMSSKKVRLGKGGRTGINTNGLHETKTLIDLVGKLSVPE